MSLPSVLGLKGLAIAIVVGAAVGGFASYKVTRAFADREIAAYKAAAVQSRLNAAKADLRIDKGARVDAAADADVIAETDRRNQEILHAPPASSGSDCDDTVGDAGARWMRSIR
ncbi:hypothetical protein SAMN02745157_1481 [Kaistia soli DSM 19436]|uniref:Uncharacterized protein n=1 Tax=Kaistia soli DSM 19436 TaxID=1122133 RepID=A0A1M4YCT7_9HYPH|nr:hypothetical protein [Kaistia soli]SHF03332.1 hypothetical protein SAMN02745157_1481 [Kaistia soli DSM 19436]